MAARVRRELNAEVEVVGGPYGQFQVLVDALHQRLVRVLVDGAPVLDAGPLAALGVLPSARNVVDALRAKLR